MKKLLIYVTFLFSSIYCFGQVEKIDSLFDYHLKSIGDTINKYATSNSEKIYINGSDKLFLYLLLDISDFRFEQHGYTHQPMLNKCELKNIKKWYKQYRNKLNSFKIYNLFRNYEDYNNTYKIIKNDDPTSYELYEQTLDSLELEHKRLENMDTFLFKN
jgi:hypothetical protein